jgi:hypothetical protein
LSKYKFIVPGKAFLISGNFAPIKGSCRGKLAEAPIVGGRGEDDLFLALMVVVISNAPSA